MRQGLLTQRFQFSSNFANLAWELPVKNDDLGFVKAEGGILKCKSVTLGRAAYAWFPLTLGIEGYVEVLFEGKRISGSSDPTQAGGIGYNQYTSRVSSIGGNLPDWIKITDEEWKPYRFVIPGSITNQFTAILIGCFTNTIGEYWFRRLEINVYNHLQTSADTRACTIIKNNAGWRVDREPTGSTNIGCYDVDVMSNYVRLKYQNTNGWGNPVVVCSVNATSGRAGWIAQPSGITREQCNISFYNAAGSQIAPSSISSLECNVIVMGG